MDQSSEEKESKSSSALTINTAISTATGGGLLTAKIKSLAAVGTRVVENTKLEYIRDKLNWSSITCPSAVEVRSVYNAQVLSNRR